MGTPLCGQDSNSDGLDGGRFSRDFSWDEKRELFHGSLGEISVDFDGISCFVGFYCNILGDFMGYYRISWAVVGLYSP